MTRSAELSRELDRLIIQGHQDSSLFSEVLRKFPDITPGEIESGLEEIGASRRIKRKNRLVSDDRQRT
jgi:hypothetical protein